MSEIIKGYTRLSHHTITGGGTFSVPSTEDFTVPGNWDQYDLALSEIGVDELGQRVYIRMGATISEFSMGGSASSETLAQTLVLGNITGGTDIVMTSGDEISSSLGDSTLNLDTSADITSTGKIALISPINIVLQSTTTKLNIQPNKIKFDYGSGNEYTFPVIDGQLDQYMITDGVGQLSWATASPGGETLAQTLVLGNDTGGTDIIMGTGSTINSFDNTAQVQLLSGQVNIYNTGSSDAIVVGTNSVTVSYTDFALIGQTRTQDSNTSTSDATVTTIDTYDFSTQDKTYVFKAYVRGIQTDGSNGYYGELMSIIRNDGGTLNQISTVDVTEKTDFTTTTSTIDFSGNDVRVRVTGEAATNINWWCKYEIIIS